MQFVFDKNARVCYIIFLVRLTILKKFFKNKFGFVLVFIFLFSTLLFACNAIALSGGPKASDAVYGNGGSAVVKGDYLYFANAFIDYEKLTNVNDNKYDSGSEYTIYGIYRTKLDSAGKVVLNSDGVPQNVEILSYNIGGFAYSGLYICGDFLYYSTPYTAKTSGANSQTKTGLVRFDRVRLNGTEHLELYKTTTYSSESSFDIVYFNNKAYIIVKDANKNLVVVDCSSTNVKNSLFAEDISSYAVMQQVNLKPNTPIAEVNKYVYYTIQNSNDGRYEMWRKPLAGGEANLMIANPSEISLVAVKNDRVYYTVSGQLYSTEDAIETKLYSRVSLSNDGSATANSIVDYVILDDSDGGASLDRGILGIYYDGTDYSFRVFNGYDDGTTSSKVEVPLSSSTVRPTLVATQNDEFFYNVSSDDGSGESSESLHMVEFIMPHNNNRFEDPIVKNTKVVAQNFSGKVNEKTMIDFDKERFFLYEQVEGSEIYYLKMFMINETPFADENENIIGQRIGVMK